MTRKSELELHFVEPDGTTDLDVAAAIAALPRGATTKGVYLDNLLRSAKRIPPETLLAEAGLDERRFLAFKDYPYEHFVRLADVTARRALPQHPTRLGVRLLARGFYDALVSTLAGKVVFGVFGRDAERIISIGPKGWEMSLNFAHVRAERLGDTHFRYHFESCPSLLDTMTVGVIEGALTFCGVVGTVRIASRDIGNAVIDIAWR